MKSQFEIDKEGGKCKMCIMFCKDKLSDLKDHLKDNLLQKHKKKPTKLIS